MASAASIFAGIDVTGDYLTEISITLPTGDWQVKRFGVSRNLPHAQIHVNSAAFRGQAKTDYVTA